MTSWLRLISTLFAACFQKAVPLNENHSLTSRVWLTEADIRLLNNSRYFSLMEVAQWNFGMRSGLVRLLRKNSWKPLAAANMIRFKKPIRRFQKFTVRTNYPYWDQKWLYCRQLFLTRDGLAAIGLNRSVYYDERRQVVEPSAIFQALGLLVRTPEKPDYVSSWEATEGALFKSTSDSH